MGVTIQFDSHTVELAGIYEYEYDPDVLEYYDQALRIKLRYSGDVPIRYRFPVLIQAVIRRRKEWEISQREVRRRVLQAAISEVPPPSIYELSARHGSGFSKFLLNREADLVEKLGHAIKSFELKRNQEIRKALEVALIELPPPTLQVLGDRLGCRPELLRRSYPEIAGKITARSRNYRSEQFRRKRKALEREVLAIATELNEVRILPRYDCIIPLLSKGKDSLDKWDDISRAIQKARRTLGLDPARTGPVSKNASESERSTRKGPENALETNLSRKRTQKAAS